MARPTKHADWWPFHWGPRRWKRTQLPTDVRSLLTLDPAERVLSYGYAVDGTPVVATDRGLWVCGADDDLNRIDWEHVGTMKPSRKQVDLTLLSADPSDLRAIRIELRDPGELVEAAWDQMADYTVAAEHVPITATAGVRVVGRRSRDGASTLWGVVADAGLDATDPSVRTEVALALEHVRREAESDYL